MIAAELDIFVPDISFLDLKKFLKETHEHHFRTPILSREETRYEKRHSRKYPWDRRVLEFNGEKYFNYNNRYPFKEIYHLIDFLPILKETRVVLLLCQDKQDVYDFNFHFDGDEKYGFRICFNLDIDKVFLEFGQLKENFLYIKNTTEQIKPDMIEKNFFLKPMKKNTIFQISGDYPHRVPIVEGNERVVLIVRGKLDNKKLNFLQEVQ